MSTRRFDQAYRAARERRVRERRKQRRVRLLIYGAGCVLVALAVVVGFAVVSGLW